MVDDWSMMYRRRWTMVDDWSMMYRRRWTMVDNWCMVHWRSSITRLRCMVNRCWLIYNNYFISFSFFFSLATEPAALLFFFLIFIVRVYPDLLVGNLRDGHQFPFLCMCYHWFLNKLGWWWLQYFLVGDIGFFYICGLVDSDGSLDLNFTIICDGNMNPSWGPKINMTVVITFTLTTTNFTTQDHRST